MTRYFFCFFFGSWSSVKLGIETETMRVCPYVDCARATVIHAIIVLLHLRSRYQRNNILNRVLELGETVSMGFISCARKGSPLLFFSCYLYEMRVGADIKLY